MDRRRGGPADLTRGAILLASFFETEYWPKEARHKSYLSVWYKHLKPRVGHLRLRQVTPPTIDRSMAVLQAVCRNALATGELTSNPVKEVRKPTVKRASQHQRPAKDRGNSLLLWVVEVRSVAECRAEPSRTDSRQVVTLMHVRNPLAALVAAGALAAAAPPARADVLGDSGKVAVFASLARQSYRSFNHYVTAGHPAADLAAEQAAIAQSRADIVAQINAIGPVAIQACSATAVQQFANVGQMSAERLQAFAADSVACAESVAADIGAETAPADVDKAGFAINIVGPIALFASADAGQQTAGLGDDLFAANELLQTQLKPACSGSALAAEDVPVTGDGPVTGHGACWNYHVGKPWLVNGHVDLVTAGPPNTAYLPWYVRGWAVADNWPWYDDHYAVWPIADFSIAIDGALADTSGAIAEAALPQLGPAAGGSGSALAATVSTKAFAPIEAMRVNPDGGLSRDELRAGDGTLSGWTGMDAQVRYLAAASNTDGRVEVFATDRIGRVLHRWQMTAGDNTSWTPWARMTGPAMASLAATRNPDGTLILFGCDPSGHLFTRHQVLGGDEDPHARTQPPRPGIDSWSDWAPMDGTLSQVAAGANADGTVELFGVNAQGWVWDRRRDAAGNWGTWNRLDGTLRRIAVTNDLGGSLNLFATDPYGQVWTRFQQGQNTESWSPWASLGGAQMSDIAAAKESFGGGRLELFAEDAHGRVWLNSADGIHGDSWRGWSAVPDGAVQQPLVTSPGTLTSGLGNAVDQAFSISGGTGPYTMSASGLPPGLSVNGTHVQGTPITAGSFTVSLTPTDAVNSAGRTTTFVWNITGATVPDVISDTPAAAGAAIAAAGLTAKQSLSKRCIDPGNVIQQFPAAGSTVAPGATVSYTVDSGTRTTCIQP